ncbi:MAG: tetratricopeptide repeat protein [Fusobacteriaceae bacterium]
MREEKIYLWEQVKLWFRRIVYWYLNISFLIIIPWIIINFTAYKTNNKPDEKIIDAVQFYLNFLKANILPISWLIISIIGYLYLFLHKILLRKKSYEKFENLPSRKEQEKDLHHYLSNDGSNSILVDGEWGSGKTYFVKGFFQSENYRKKYKAIWIKTSLFDSRNDIQKFFLRELGLFFKSQGIPVSPIKEIVKKFNILTQNKFNLSRFESSLEEDFKYAKKLCLSASKKIVVVLDDLERLSCTNKQKEIIGFISELEDFLGLNTILIMNSEENKDREFFEKYVDVKIKIKNLTHEEVIEKFIDDELDKKVIINFIEKLFENYETSNDEESVKLLEKIIEKMRTPRFVKNLNFYLINMRKIYLANWEEKEKSFAVFVAYILREIFYENLKIIFYYFKFGNYRPKGSIPKSLDPIIYEVNILDEILEKIMGKKNYELLNNRLILYLDLSLREINDIEETNLSYTEANYEKNIKKKKGSDSKVMSEDDFIPVKKSIAKIEIENYSNLAFKEEEKGNYDEALKQYEKAFEFITKTYGENSLEIGDLYNNIGSSYEESGKFEKAIDYYKKALNIFEKLKGKERVRIAPIYINLGEVYKSTKEYIKSFDCFKNALETYKKYSEEKNPNIPIIINNLGEICSVNADYKKAIDYYYEALSLAEELYGHESFDVAKISHNLAKSLEYLKEFKRSEIYYYSAFNIANDLHGPKHEFTKEAKENLERVQNKIEEEKKRKIIYENI